MREPLTYTKTKTTPQATKAVADTMSGKFLFSSTKVHDLASDGCESHPKEKPDKLSFTNATRCRHNHKTRHELNVSKNDLFTDSVNMNIHKSLNKFIFFLPNFIFQNAIYTSYVLFVFIFCYMHIKLFV